MVDYNNVEEAGEIKICWGEIEIMDLLYGNFLLKKLFKFSSIDNENYKVFAISGFCKHYIVY